MKTDDPEQIIDDDETPVSSLKTEHRDSVESPVRQSSMHLFDHSEYGKYADSMLEKEDEVGDGIKLHIVGNENRATTFSKYTVYHIVGQDKNGEIDVFRRFNQFYKMRVALIKRFPGCFVPSIPDKAISLVDQQIVNKRQRYLNDFIRKVTRLSHLYNSQEFQALLRSQEKDLSASFDKWPSPTTTDIINRYKDHFSQLAGKEITTELRAQIHAFGKLISKTQKSMLQFKDMVKKMAAARDKFDHHFARFFGIFIPSFEQQCLKEYVWNESELITLNNSEAKFEEHGAVLRQILKNNPYWLLYDLIRHEERDSKAFLESIAAVELYENKKYELDLKISENNKAINELILSKRSNSEQKFKLQIENETNKKQKEAVECLMDIIIALVAYIQIDRFKREKTKFYQNFLKKLGGYEISMVQNIVEIWKDWNKKTDELLQKYA